MNKLLLAALLTTQLLAALAMQAQYILTQNNLLNGAMVFTVEFWVKTSENRSSNIYWQRPCIFGNETNGDNSGDFAITLNNGYIGMFEGVCNLNTDQQFLSTSIRINDNFYHHIAAVNNGQTISLYVDGVMTGRTNFRQAITDAACTAYLWRCLT